LSGDRGANLGLSILQELHECRHEIAVHDFFIDSFRDLSAR
jgi:hypothetical protein